MLDNMKNNKENLQYWRVNAEENYDRTPLSVLKYITELEKDNSLLYQGALIGGCLGVIVGVFVMFVCL